MYQSAITTGKRATWSASHASRPSATAVTANPAAPTSAPSCVRATGSSSATRTATASATEVLQHGAGLALQGVEPAAGGGDVALARGRLHVLQQGGQARRADGGGGRLEGVRGAPDRLGIVAGRRGRQRREPRGESGDEGGDDLVGRRLGARLAHRRA